MVGSEKAGPEVAKKPSGSSNSALLARVTDFSLEAALTSRVQSITDAVARHDRGALPLSRPACSPRPNLFLYPERVRSANLSGELRSARCRAYPWILFAW